MLLSVTPALTHSRTVARSPSPAAYTNRYWMEDSGSISSLSAKRVITPISLLSFPDGLISALLPAPVRAAQLYAATTQPVAQHQSYELDQRQLPAPAPRLGDQPEEPDQLQAPDQCGRATA